MGVMGQGMHENQRGPHQHQSDVVRDPHALGGDRNRRANGDHEQDGFELLLHAAECCTGPRLALRSTTQIARTAARRP